MLIVFLGGGIKVAGCNENIHREAIAKYIYEEIQEDYTEEEHETTAKKYTVGKTLDNVLNETKRLNSLGWRVLINKLSEGEVNVEVANDNTELYCRTLDEIAAMGLNASISLKLTSLGLGIDSGLAYRNIECVVQEAMSKDLIVEIDMESKSYVHETIRIAEKLLKNGLRFRIAVQTGLERTKRDVLSLIATAIFYDSQVGFRIVTGSCYSKNGQGYETTLEQGAEETDKLFYELVDIVHEYEEDGGLKSAVGTFDLKRLQYAAELALELQGLKGCEDTEGQQFITKNIWEVYAAMYVAFGYSKAYLKRRLDAERKVKT